MNCIVADFDQTMGAKFIYVGNNFLVVTRVLVNRDRSASNHHIYIQFMLFYNLQFITQQGSGQTALKSVIGQTSHRLNMTHPWIQNLEVVIYFFTV